LGKNRVLWTFGDSFVDTNPDPTRRQRRTAQFLRNSVAIQTGRDPSQADFHPYWQKNRDGTPVSFFRSEGEVFYWPGGGLLLDQKLLLFLMRIRNAKTGLRFSVVGWGAVLVHHPQDCPKDWTMKYIATPQNPYGIIVGSGSSIRVADWIYSFGAEDALRHKIYLTRLPVADAMVGDFSNLQWWNGPDATWLKQAEIVDRPPLPIVNHGQTEFTVHYESRLKSYLLTQFMAFPHSCIAVRGARKLIGPWSQLQAVFRPEESDITRSDTMVYAAKAHPELTANGLAVTYCTNTFHLATVRKDESLYYPRFVRFVFQNHADDEAK